MRHETTRPRDHEAQDREAGQHRAQRPQTHRSVPRRERPAQRHSHAEAHAHPPASSWWRQPLPPLQGPPGRTPPSRWALRVNGGLSNFQRSRLDPTLETQAGGPCAQRGVLFNPCDVYTKITKTVLACDLFLPHPHSLRGEAPVLPPDQELGAGHHPQTLRPGPRYSEHPRRRQRLRGLLSHSPSCSWAGAPGEWWPSPHWAC